MRHKEKPGKRQAGLDVDRLDALHHAVNGNTLFVQQPFGRHLEPPWNETELAPGLVLIIRDVESSMLENPLRGSAGPLPVLEHSDLARDKIEPSRIEIQEWCLLNWPAAGFSETKLS